MQFYFLPIKEKCITLIWGNTGFLTFKWYKPLFSERSGYSVPQIKIGKFRLQWKCNE